MPVLYSLAAYESALDRAEAAKAELIRLQALLPPLEFGRPLGSPELLVLADMQATQAVFEAALEEVQALADARANQRFADTDEDAHA